MNQEINEAAKDLIKYDFRNKDTYIGEDVHISFVGVIAGFAVLIILALYVFLTALPNIVYLITRTIFGGQPFQFYYLNDGYILLIPAAIAAALFVICFIKKLIGQADVAKKRQQAYAARNRKINTILKLNQKYPESKVFDFWKWDCVTWASKKTKAAKNVGKTDPNEYILVDGKPELMFFNEDGSAYIDFGKGGVVGDGRQIKQFLEKTKFSYLFGENYKIDDNAEYELSYSYLYDFSIESDTYTVDSSSDKNAYVENAMNEFDRKRDNQERWTNLIDNRQFLTNSERYIFDKNYSDSTFMGDSTERGYRQWEAKKKAESSYIAKTRTVSSNWHTFWPVGFSICEKSTGYWVINGLFDEDLYSASFITAHTGTGPKAGRLVSKPYIFYSKPGTPLDKEKRLVAIEKLGEYYKFIFDIDFTAPASSGLDPEEYAHWIYAVYRNKKK